MDKKEENTGSEIKKIINIKDITTCEATAQMLEKAAKDGVETAFDRAAAMKPCPIGAESACCKHCAMGPCRLNARDPYGKVGVCGVSIDTIQARNFGRMIACGTAAHTDHGMVMLDLFRDVVTGKIKDYEIKDPLKLEALAKELGIETEGKEITEIALAVYHELERTYIQVDGEIPFVKRVPEKTLELWRKHGIVPRGAMREIMELNHRTAMGVDQDYENLIKQCSRTALVDGWGGSMVATEISDILYGTPTPVRAEVNMGCLKADQVNIIIHGHEPNLFESIIDSSNDPTLIQAAKEAGAAGINLVGMCCSGAEMLARHGIPHAGNFMSTEAVLVTGAVDAMGVDVQCIKQGLAKVAECYGTKLFTTNPRCRLEGVEHIEFHEHTPRECTDAIVENAIVRFKNRKMPIQIPNIKNSGVFGFSHEYINYMLGGSFRGSYTPLNDNIINSRILTACAEMVRTGGLGSSIADLPVAGAAPEWMSEKAIAIGQYFVASGVFTVFGVTFPTVKETRFHKMLFEGLENQGFGKWGFAVDPHEMAQMIIAHIDKKRKALGIDQSRERVLMDMAARQRLEAA